MDKRKLKQNLGGNLTRCRWLRQMTSVELADRLGVAVQTVTRIEKGQTFPGADVLVDISEALDVPVEFLLLNPSKIIKTGREHRGTPSEEFWGLRHYDQLLKDWHRRKNGKRSA